MLLRMKQMTDCCDDQWQIGLIVLNAVSVLLGRYCRHCAADEQRTGDKTTLVPINTVRCLKAVYGATKPVNVLVNIVNPPPIDRV